MAATAKKKRHVLTPEQSRRRSEITRRVKPWLKSTGPRTRAGKAVVRMNALKAGEHDARARAIDRFLTVMDRVSQCLNAMGWAELGMDPKRTRFLNNVMFGEFSRLCGQIGVELPPDDCDDVQVWGRYLSRMRKARPPVDLPESVANVPLLAVCEEIRAERYSTPTTLLG